MSCSQSLLHNRIVFIPEKIVRLPPKGSNPPTVRTQPETPLDELPQTVSDSAVLSAPCQPGSEQANMYISLGNTVRLRGVNPALVPSFSSFDT